MQEDEDGNWFKVAFRVSGPRLTEASTVTLILKPFLGHDAVARTSQRFKGRLHSFNRKIV